MNVLTPLDTASGSVLVDFMTEQGTVMTTTMMAQVPPVAQIANTSAIVAPVGAFGSAPIRPAQAGDFVLLLYRSARLLFSGHAAVAVENAAFQPKLARRQRGLRTDRLPDPPEAAAAARPDLRWSKAEACGAGAHE